MWIHSTEKDLFGVFNTLVLHFSDDGGRIKTILNSEPHFRVFLFKSLWIRDTFKINQKMIGVELTNKFTFEI